MIADLQQRLARIAFDRGGLLGVLALAFYAWLAPANIVGGDNPEFATLGTIGGVAHPSGYPLYLIWLRLWSWLPGTSAAHTTALATALLGAATVVVLHAACRAWGARPLAATIACAIVAAAPMVMRLSSEAEAFALNNLVCATILWLAAHGGPLRGLRRAAVLGLVAGLGISDHLTCVLLAPVGILGVVRGARESGRAAVAVALAAAGLVLGLVPYAYLLATAENAASWGRHIDGLGALVHHFLRKDYGGPDVMSPGRDAVAATANLAQLGARLARAWLWLPLAAGLGVLALRIARPRDAGEPRWGWAMLALSLVLAGPVLWMQFNIPLAGPGLFIVGRFSLLPALLLAIPVAAALDLAGDRLVLRWRASDVLAVVAFAALGVTSVRFVEEGHSPAVEQCVRNLLHQLPKDGVAIVSEDDLDFGSAYVQLILGERPDVTVIMWTAVPQPAYRERLEAKLGMKVPVAGADIFSTQFADAVLATGRPLYVDQFESHILKAFPSYPEGLLFRVLPRGTPRPPIDDVVAINKKLYAAYQFGYPVPRADADWSAHAQERYVRTWQILYDGLRAVGKDDDAAFAYELARTLLPRP